MIIKRLAKISPFLMALMIGSTVFLAWTCRFRFPFADDWPIIERLLPWFEGRGLSFQVLWAQHNEHRIALLRGIFGFDYLYFGGTFKFAVIVSVFFQGINLLLFWKWIDSISEVYGLSSDWRKTLKASVAFFLFAPQLALDYCREGGIFATYSLSHLTFWLLYWSTIYKEQRKQYLCLFCAILTAILASLSMGQGVLIWPFIVVYVMLMPFGWLKKAFIAGIAVLAYAFYFQDFVFPPYHSTPIMALGHPIKVLEYWFTFLGNSSPHFFPLGFGVLAVTLIFWIGQFVYRQSSWRNPILFLGLLNFGFLLTASVTAATTRFHFGPPQALSSKYVLTTSVIWAYLSLGGSVVFKATASSRNIRGIVLRNILVVPWVFSFLTVLQLPAIFIFFDKHFRLTLATEVAFLQNQYDAEIFSAFPSGQTQPVTQGISWLKSHNLSVFAHPIGPTELQLSLVRNFKGDISSCGTHHFLFKELKSTKGYRFEGQVAAPIGDWRGNSWVIISDGGPTLLGYGIFLDHTKHFVAYLASRPQNVQVSVVSGDLLLCTQNLSDQ